LKAEDEEMTLAAAQTVSETLRRDELRVRREI
jgi:hypothetical protein